VSRRNCPPVDPGAEDHLNNVHEDANHATSKAIKTGMDKVGVSTAQSDTGLEKAHTKTDTVTGDSDRTTPEDGINNDHKLATDANSKVSPNVINKVGPDVKDDNDVAKAADGANGAFNNDNNDAPDKDKDDNVVTMVRLY
jgi:hypothetical protein